MTVMKCMIVDDEPIGRRVLQEFIEEVDFLQLVAEADNPVKASSLLHKYEPDLIFLDINMPKISGLQFLASTRLTAKVILTTAYSEFAVQAYNLDVIDYILKPIAFERFLQACVKAKNASRMAFMNPLQLREVVDHFFVRCDGVLQRVLYNEVIYVEAKMNYVMIHLESRKLMVYLTIANLEQQLPDDIFIKVHKSYVVNKRRVNSIRGNVLDMGVREIPISQTLKDEVINKIVNNQLVRRQ